MKKNLFILGLIPMMLLASCSGHDISDDSNNSGGGNNPPTSEIDPNIPKPDDNPDAKLISVIFFESAVNCQPEKAFFKTKAYVGGKVLKPAGTPTSTDPAFNVFKGWSSKQIVMSDDDYWDFGKDIIPKTYKEQSFRIYGQWDFVG